MLCVTGQRLLKLTVNSRWRSPRGHQSDARLRHWVSQCTRMAKPVAVEIGEACGIFDIAQSVRIVCGKSMGNDCIQSWATSSSVFDNLHNVAQSTFSRLLCTTEGGGGVSPLKPMPSDIYRNIYMMATSAMP